jgi:chloramphenicol O-acetyltransferase
MGYNDNIPARYKLFTGGNMFAGNTQLFQQSLLPYQDKFKDLLKNEIGKVDEQYDGTYCHAFERIFGYISYLHGYRFSYSCPTLFKIITPTIHSKYLHFRLLYNNDIYCYDQANIFGNIIAKNHNMLSIKWLHNNENTIQEYRKVANNTFINSKYID